MNNAEAKRFYAESIEVLKESITELEEYVLKNPTFKTIGQRMLDSWTLSLDEKTYKEIPNEIVRHWKKG